MAANPVPFSQLNVSTHTAPDESVITCSGRLTSDTVSSLQNAVAGLLPQTKSIAIDLTDVTFVDSMGLGALVGLYVSAKRAGSKLRVINLNARIKDLFSLTHLGTVLCEGRDPESIGLP
jgi:anti-sigma B factor antagonist